MMKWTSLSFYLLIIVKVFDLQITQVIVFRFRAPIILQSNIVKKMHVCQRSLCLLFTV